MKIFSLIAVLFFSQVAHASITCELEVDWDIITFSVFSGTKPNAQLVRIFKFDLDTTGTEAKRRAYAAMMIRNTCETAEGGSAENSCIQGQVISSDVPCTAQNKYSKVCYGSFQACKKLTQAEFDARILQQMDQYSEFAVSFPLTPKEKKAIQDEKTLEKLNGKQTNHNRKG